MLNADEAACDDDDRVAHRTTGEGPVLLLVHGMAASSVTWKHAVPALFTTPGRLALFEYGLLCSYDLLLFLVFGVALGLFLGRLPAY